MEIIERRNKILEILCRRRKETMSNLATELGISMRTIQRDINELSIRFPIYTKHGRYDGGVYLMDGYYIDRMYMDYDEIAVLQKLSEADAKQKVSKLNQTEKEILSKIISKYTKPAV